MKFRVLRWIILGPVLILLTAELFMQIGALLVQSTHRKLPSNWITHNTRVLTLGDSNTYGIYLPENQSYPAQLQEQWNQRFPDQPIEVLNMGYPGMSSFRVLDNFNAMVETVKPDLILLLVGTNDFWAEPEMLKADNFSMGRRLRRFLHDWSRVYRLYYMWQQSRAALNEVDMGKRADFGWIEEQKYRIGKMLAWKRDKANEKNEEVITFGKKKFVVARDGRSSGHIHYLKLNLGKMALLAQQHEVPLYLLTYPASKGYYRDPNIRIREAAIEFGLPLIDLEDAFRRECPDSSQCPVLFFGDLHPNAAGYTKAASLIVDRLSNDWVMK